MLLTQILGLLLLHHKYKLTEGGFNECQTAKTCKDCIILNPKCSWCNVLEYRDSETKYRYKKCDTVENHKNQQCAHIHNPESEANITKDSKLDGDVRVSPQEIRIKLRPGQPTNVTIRIKTPKNFPIDLYYLMDLSKSMTDDKANVAKLGDILSKEMKNVTSDFRLGFGGYVDKPLTPYTITYQGEINTIIEQMKAEGVDAQYTFAFHNYLPLNDNTNNFASSVNKTKISFNRDSPEGTLDALMQVVVCSDAIGWRNKKQARRIVIITTDQTFHYSGDGLLGGVVTPNDAACRLKNNSQYTGWNQFDYPSLSQIRALMLDNQIVPIFASLGNVELYEDVARFFGDESGAIAKRLADDSSNVVPLIKEAYEKIAKKVSVTSTAPGDVTVKYFTRCGVEGQALVESASCNNVSIGQEVEFIAQISSRECKPGVATERLFKLKTDFDDVDVVLEMVCDCPCKDEREENSPQCSGNGTLSCGLCQCNPLHTGSICSCLKSENTEDKALCAVNRLPGRSVCGGHECDCGECLCPDIFEQLDINQQKTGLWVYIYGQQCECSNATCDFSNTPPQICGGPERGRCDCGKCVCNENWTGERCQDRCEQSQAACISKEGVICGGKGTCVCNKCVCDEGHVGEQCTECIERCPDPCEDFKECVKCLEFDTSELSQTECYAECGRWNISTDYETVEKIPDRQKRCIARDDDDCSYVYTYKKQNDTDVIFLTVQEGLICPAEPDIVAIILGVIAGIVGIGLALLLIWKLLATIQDRRDFAMFEKDRQNPKWDSGENPIYKEATSTFQNPMFKKSQAS